MDYERKYKELVANFKSVLNLRTVKENGTIPTEDVRKLIPELQTSNDGEIIKELIDYLDVQDTLSKGKDSDFKNWIAWLKKQKEKEPDTRSNYLEELIAADDIYQMAMNEAMVEEAKTKAMHALSKLGISNILFQDTLAKGKDSDFKTWISWLKKQNEKEHHNFYCQENCKGFQETGKCFADGECEAKRNAEQNPAKFKTGDWIVTPDDQIKQIENVTFGNYLFTDKTYYNIIDVDNKGHLWTIQDAHDGDVLSFKDHSHYVIGIVKPIERRNTVDAYCLIEDHRFKKGMFYNLDTEDPHPATNEQRNTLIEKMKEAGYEWDEEKKGLKELSEQNGIDILEKEIPNIYDRYDADELSCTHKTHHSSNNMNIIDTIIQNTNLIPYKICARYNQTNEPTIAIPLLSDLTPKEIYKLSPQLTHHHDNTISQITTQELDNLIHLVNIHLEFHPTTLPLTIISSKPLPLTTKPSHEEPFIYIISP